MGRRIEGVPPLRARPSGEVGDEKRVGLVTLVVDGEAAGQASILAKWTEDEALSTRINRRVAEVMDETELADALQAGVDALRADDMSKATGLFGKAARLAHEAGNAEALDRLSKVVDIEDAATGRVKAKPKVDDVDMMIIESRSVRTGRTGRTGP